MAILTNINVCIGVVRGSDPRLGNLEFGSQPARPAVAELVAAFLQASIANRSETRLLAWQGLSDDPDRPEAPEEVELMRAMVADLRRRQAEGELADDLDPAAVLLAFFGAVAVPTILPQIARRIYGDADSATFVEDYAEQLRRLVRHLQPRSTAINRSGESVSGQRPSWQEPGSTGDT